MLLLAATALGGARESPLSPPARRDADAPAAERAKLRREGPVSVDLRWVSRAAGACADVTGKGVRDG